MKKIIVASDSFKGCLSSSEVAHAAAEGIREVFPDCEVLEIPVADGGEGTVDALVRAMDGTLIRCRVHDPLMHIIESSYGILGDGKTAVIEMASASGLTLVPEEKRNPLLTTTYGTGELIKDALLRGCDRFLIGIGGSATNDAGTGMLQALGFRFLDGKGDELGKGGHILEKICSIDHSQVMPQLQTAVFTIACDVNNPFSGENGAAWTYARQKGADEWMIRQLDNGLKHFANIILETEQRDIDCIPGAGAAGGLGGGFLAFLRATLKSGVQMVLEVLDFDEQIRGADLLITGEGRMDRQTGMGKTPAGILEAGEKQGIPVIAIAGSIEDTGFLNQLGFLAVFPIQPGVVMWEKAMDKEFASQNIQRTVEQQLRIMHYFQSLK